jgi:glycosyltransferase involved in cell wall biosynthesis
LDVRNSDPVNVALVEPYYGGSHKMWADGFVNTSSHDVRLFTHDARFWKWRMHGAFLTLAEQLTQDLATNGSVDLILVSSMMDVAAFAGAIRHSAPGVPIAVYFHESQFTYPLSPADKTDLTYPMKNWASAAVADLAVFNSEYHRALFDTEVRKFLNVFPDEKHVRRIDEVMNASAVLPVGVDLTALVHADRIKESPPLLVWNHRWEHDKGPDDLSAIVRELLTRDVDFRMAMCGEVFVSVPDEFASITQMLGDRLVHEGWAPRDRYESLLREATVSISTAHQEFFGVGVIEAIAAGAHPVLPDRLVYPERVSALDADPSDVLYSSTDHAADLILAALSGQPSTLREATLQYDWSNVAPQYDTAVSVLA